MTIIYKYIIYIIMYSVTKGKSLKEIASSLLSPVIETLGGARTRAYIDHTHLVSIIQLLSSLLQLLLDGEELMTTVKSKPDR